MIIFEDDKVIIATSSMTDGAMGSSQNPGPVDDTHPNGRYKANRDKFVASLKLNPMHIVMLGLAHKDRIAADEEVVSLSRIPDTDGAIWMRHTSQNPAVVVSHSDCIAYAVMGPDVLALGHAGWRGLLAGIVTKTISGICSDDALAPADLVVFTSPFIQSCHFEVGADDPDGGVPRYEQAGYGRYVLNVSGSPHVDLAGIFREQCVRDMKIPRENVMISPECTYSNNYWSARRAKHNREASPQLEGYQNAEGRNNITVAAFK